MGSNGKKTLVIRNGTLIDGSGSPASPNDAIVIEGNRIRAVGSLPGDLHLEDRDHVEVIDATGKWVMPGLVEGHCHLAFGHPDTKGTSLGKGAISREFATLKGAINVGKVLRAGVTSLSVPGGTWFIDVALRDAISAGLIEGPRIYCAERFITTYHSNADREPSWVGIPEHHFAVMANTRDEMIAEVRRQLKHGVDFIKLDDSVFGDFQVFSLEDMTAIVVEAHRRNARVAIHARGGGATRTAALAGVDWIMHADMATEEDLEVAAECGSRIMPTLAFMMYVNDSARDWSMSAGMQDSVKRNVESCLKNMQLARKMGIKILAGTDTGNTSIWPYAKYHGREAEILVKEIGFSPMEAIVTNTKENAFTVGLEDEVGTIEVGKLADVIILNGDPLADIRVLQGGDNLAAVIKDGKIVDLNPPGAEDDMLVFKQAG